MPAVETFEPLRSTQTANSRPRDLVVSWQDPRTRNVHPVGLLQYDGAATYAFTYIHNVLSIPDFRPLLGFPDLYAFYEAEHLFPLFAQRVMDARRPDFARYVDRLGLSEDATPWEQITRSEGRRQGDTLQLLPVPAVEQDVLTCRFLVNGIRHVSSQPARLRDATVSVTREQVDAALQALRVGSPLVLLDEPGNPKNPAAIITADSAQTPLGYVPDLLVADVHRLREQTAISVTVERINGPDAPWHLRLLAILTAHLTADFRFFEGDQWTPLSSATASN